MAKNIVFCADGTWNGPEDKTGVSVIDDDDAHGEISNSSVTNVVKLFANVVGQPTAESAMLRNEQEKVLRDANGAVVQVAKYIHGVGDSRNPVKKVLGGVFGLGIVARIVRGYTFLSRHYDADDRIYLVGFSRGAYTARALGGLIAKVGLLNRATYDPNDQATAYRLALAAWSKAKTLSFQSAGRLSTIANHALGLAQEVFALQLPRNGLIPNVPIRALGVWDTVGSLGIPKYDKDGRYDLFRFVDTKLSDTVQSGFHAMAIDERRVDFPVTSWDNRAGIEQVWFVGAHADVGGGYPQDESRLADTGLSWMMKKLADAGVRFSDPLAYVPKPLTANQPIHKPWTQPPFNLGVETARAVALGHTFHASVVDHWRADETYAFAGESRLTRAMIDKLVLDKTLYA
jgi:glutathione S-transferase